MNGDSAIGLRIDPPNITWAAAETISAENRDSVVIVHQPKLNERGKTRLEIPDIALAYGFHLTLVSG